VWLARNGSAGTLEYWKIDLFQRHGDLELGWLQQASYQVFKDPAEVPGVRIEIVPATRWCEPDRSRTWTISSANADRAYQEAVTFRQHQKEYFFSKFGLGIGGYNCSTFAAQIVKAAGVDASAGLLIDTPGQIALGERLPVDKLRPKPPSS
jgi:hypothetical protein